MENKESKISNPEPIVSEQIQEPIQTSRKTNYPLLYATLTFLGAIILVVFFFTDSNMPVDDDKIIPSPTIEETITVAPSTTPEFTPTVVVTEVPIVSGSASMVFVDKNTLNVFTNDLVKTSSIDVDGTILACNGSPSGYCLIKDHKISSLVVDRSSKLVATKSYTMNYGEDELTPYMPYIDLKNQKYIYMKGDPKNEMKINYFTRSFSGIPSSLLFSFEGEGTSGYRINTLLSTGEIVLHLQGSVYNPNDPRTLLIINNQANVRNCETKEFLDVYHGDYRYYTNYIYDDTNKAQTVQLRQIELQTCKDKVIDTILNVSGKSEEVPLTTFADKYMMATYRDVSGTLRVRVYTFSNFVKAPVEFSLPNIDSKFVPYGYREDTKSLVGILGDTGYDNVVPRIAVVSGNKIVISKNGLPKFSTGNIYDLLIFLIP